MNNEFLTAKPFVIPGRILTTLLFCIGLSTARGQEWETIASGSTQHLNGVFITADGAGAVAVGNGGTVLSFDGTTWSPVPGAPDVDFIEVHGTRLDYFVAGGIDELWHCSNGVWNVLATNAPGEYAYTPVHVSADESTLWWQTFKTASGGFPFHFLSSTGNDWSTAHQTAILAFAQDGPDVRYVDQNGSIYGTDAALFTTNLYDNSSTPIFSLTAAWFVPGSLDEVFAIRNESQIYHFNGGAWSFMTNHSARLTWVGGTAANDVYVIGVNTTTGDGVMHHYNGAQWSAITLPAGSKGLIDIAFPPSSPLALATLPPQETNAGNAATVAGVSVGEAGTIVMRNLVIFATAVYITNFRATTGALFLALTPTLPDRTYGLEGTGDLESNLWDEITNSIPGTGEAIFINVSFIPNLPVYYLRAFSVPAQ